jgi:hypothetical protein
MAAPTGDDLNAVYKEIKSDEGDLPPLEQVVNPASLEEKMVEKALAEDPTGTPADKAAAFFQRSVGDLKVHIDRMSLRGLKRMILYQATYPFLGKEYKLKVGSPEYKAAYRFNEMITQKVLMQLQFEHEKAMKAMEDGKVSDNQLTLNKGESDNDTSKE